MYGARSQNNIPVEVENRQYRTIGNRVQELRAMPRGRQGSRLTLAIANHSERDEVRVIEDGAECMGDGVPELAALVERARSLRRCVRSDTAREGELLEEATHAFLVLGNGRVDLGIDSFKVRLRENSGCAMAYEDARCDQKSFITRKGN